MKRNIIKLSAVLMVGVLAGSVMTGCGEKKPTAEEALQQQVNDAISQIEDAAGNISIPEISADTGNTGTGDDAGNTGTGDNTDGEPSEEGSTIMPADYQPTSSEFFSYRIIDASTAVITEYTGTDTEVRLPKRIEDGGTSYKVVGVTSGTFSKNSAVKSVTIPDYDTTAIIWLDNCESLESVTSYSLKAPVCDHCSSLKEVTFKNTTGVFNPDSKNEQITDEYCNDFCASSGSFSECVSLKEIHFPGEVKILPCFASCEALEKVTADGTIHEIPDYGFKICTNLKTIDLSKTEAIGEEAFYDCKALTEVTVAENAALGRSAFVRCDNLTKATVYGDKTDISQSELGFYYYYKKKKPIESFVLYDSGEQSLAHQYAVDNGLTDKTIGS